MRYFDGVLALAAFGLGVKDAVDGQYGWALMMFAMATFLAWLSQSGHRASRVLEDTQPDGDVTSTQEIFLNRGYEPVETPVGDERWNDSDWWQKHRRECPGCRERN